MSDVYSEYKPLRNYLGRANLFHGLHAVWWYINYLQHPQSPPDRPADLEVARTFYSDGFRSFLPWHLAVLARELVINAAPTSLALPHDLRAWRHVASAVNKLHDLDGYISQAFVNQENIYHAISKVTAHQQFVWQENRPNRHTMTRYYYIYRHPDLRPIFERAYGMPVEIHFMIGLTAWLKYTGQFGLTYPPRIDFHGAGFEITREQYDLFLERYAWPLDTLRAKLIEEQHFDYDFFTYFDALRGRPIIEMKIDGSTSHVCPVPTYLFWRATDGIYYDLVKERGFDQALGTAFKDYIGEVMHAQSYRQTVEVVDADRLIEDEHAPKSDWLVVENEEAAFVECKAKRMTVGAKFEPDFGVPTEEQLRKLAGFVIQCYRAVLDANARGYQEVSAVTRFYPVVVTMENWYVQGDVAAKLADEVRRQVKAVGMDDKVIVDAPYLVLSSQEYESLSVLLRSHTLGEIIKPFFEDAQYSSWQFRAYLDRAFSSESSSYQIFESDVLAEMVSLLTSSDGPDPTAFDIS